MALLLPIESYAVNGAKPIYEAEYQYPALADGWYRIHDTLRAEMALFRKCLEKCSGPLEAWQADALKTTFVLEKSLRPGSCPPLP